MGARDALSGTEYEIFEEKGESQAPTSFGSKYIIKSNGWQEEVEWVLDSEQTMGFLTPSLKGLWQPGRHPHDPRMICATWSLLRPGDKAGYRYRDQAAPSPLLVTSS